MTEISNTVENSKGFRAFLKRKDIEFSSKRYLQDALSAMAMGLFCSLLVGLILKTIGQQSINFFGETTIANTLIEIGGKAMELMGAAIGVAVAFGLKAPALVMISCCVTGMMGSAAGGPAGAFIAAAVGAELGKMISKETKVDIIVTPALTLLSGGVVAILVGPAIGKLMNGLGSVIMTATEWQPFAFGMMLGLSGLAAGAATAGCCAQMVGFAIISFRDNGIGGLVAQGIGTSMLQISNIIKNPYILVPPTLAGAITGPLSTVVFKMTNSPLGAGMGTSGLVGQIGTFTTMGGNAHTIAGVAILHFVLPAVLALIFDRVLRKMGKIKDGDYKLNI